MPQNRKNKKKASDIEDNKKAARIRTGIASFLVIIIIVAALGALIYFPLGTGEEGFQPSSFIQPQRNQTGIADFLSIPVGDINSKANFFSYNSSGVTIRFFLVSGAGRNIHLAADACDSCFENKEGFRQTGDQMKCNNCGQSFEIDRINATNPTGKCWPSNIPFAIDGGNVIISIDDINEKRFMFA